MSIFAVFRRMPRGGALSGTWLDNSGQKIDRRTIHLILFDAYENRDYAEYMWIPREGKKYWEVALISCRLFPSSGNERFCKSEAEYDDFVAAYME
jgi:hypothetical protein